MTNPINRAIDTMIADQEQRHAWLFVAGEQCRKWREEESNQGGSRLPNKRASEDQ